jgi:CrcB protein
MVELARRGFYVAADRPDTRGSGKEGAMRKPSLSRERPVAELPSTDWHCLTARRTTVTTILSIALGAALGANLRYAVSVWAAQRWDTAFPYGTLLINVGGSFVIGLLMAFTTTRTSLSVPWQRLLITGFLGGFTTFSTFSYETYSLLIGGNWLAAALNIVGSVGLGLLGVFLGAGLVRLVL